MSNKYLLSAIFLIVVIQLSLISFAYLQFATRSNGDFFGVFSPNENPIPLTPLERPNVSTKALLSWVTLAATATFTFDFVNYKDQINALTDYFTTDGYDNFMNSLQNAGTLNTIEEKKLIVSAVAVGPAIVLTEDERANNHTWRIQVPLLVRYQSANVNENRQQVIEVLVTQVPTSDAPKGIGIAQYIARDMGSGVSTY